MSHAGVSDFVFLCLPVMSSHPDLPSLCFSAAVGEGKVHH